MIGSSSLLNIGKPQDLGKHRRKSRWLRSNEKWMKDIRPTVPNPYYAGFENQKSLPAFVPKNVRDTLANLQFVSTDTLQSLRFSLNEEPSQISMVQRMKNAVQYQQGSVKSVHELIHSNCPAPPHSFQPPCQDVKIFEEQQADEVSLVLEHDCMSELSPHLEMQSECRSEQFQACYEPNYNMDNLLLPEFRQYEVDWDNY